MQERKLYFDAGGDTRCWCRAVETCLDLGLEDGSAPPPHLTYLHPGLWHGRRGLSDRSGLLQVGRAWRAVFEQWLGSCLLSLGVDAAGCPAVTTVVALPGVAGAGGGLREGEKAGRESVQGH
eukprot:1892429-Rhodomonas_salina.1